MIREPKIVYDLKIDHVILTTTIFNNKEDDPNTFIKYDWDSYSMEKLLTYNEYYQTHEGKSDLIKRRFNKK